MSHDMALREDLTGEPAENVARKVFRGDFNLVKRCAHDAPYEFRVKVLTADAAPGADAGIEYRTTWSSSDPGDITAIELIGTTLLRVDVEDFGGAQLDDSTVQNVIEVAVARVRSPKIYPGAPTIIMAPEPLPG